MARNPQRTGPILLWLLRVVLFAVGFAISVLVVSCFWNAPPAQPPDNGWSTPVIVIVGLICGTLSAVFGRWFWVAFFSAF
jgi:hypothetical protein